ncbi:hypothetical protein GGU10DRAFT_419427 [Lentinula aff. detonsa]|uniref:Uncharacterized protein n=1 Tax=Lentinula aff. detonsa TaxID=2804958 RepID=A0AA38NSK6_9AGAR|nr:hypothetical protein GGU10DRAFT_419427 [Lentinula aff. detonsa]
MPMRYSVLMSEIDIATRATVTALKSLNLDCCLVGSVACFAYGMSRTPNDIDMVVLTSRYTQERLKSFLVHLDARFYLIASKDPSATYRVLWFRLPGYHRSCKVDLLLPGIMNIPSVDPNRVVRIQDSMNVLNSPGYASSLTLSTDYPLMPFLPLLLLKLQAWQDHGESPKLFMRQKQPTDVRDIQELLAEQKYATAGTDVRKLRLVKSRYHKETTVEVQTKQPSLLQVETPYLPESFVQAGKTRVRKFIGMYPWSEKQWKILGFSKSDITDATIAAGKSAQGDIRSLEDMMSSLVIDL